MSYKTDFPDNVTEVFNDGQQAYYKVKMDFSQTFTNSKENLIKEIDFHLQNGSLYDPDKTTRDEIRNLLIDMKHYLVNSNG